MQNSYKVSTTPAVQRLPAYYRVLKQLKANGEKKISSKGLSEKTRFSASQIRRDFVRFGDFGRKGYGHSILALYSTIEDIIGMNNYIPAILIGMGNLEKAVYVYHTVSFNKGINIIGLFDKDQDLIGQKIDGNAILNIKDLKGFWNFSSYDIKKISGCVVENTHLSDSMMTPSYLLNDKLKRSE